MNIDNLIESYFELEEQIYESVIAIGLIAALFGTLGFAFCLIIGFIGLALK